MRIGARPAAAPRRLRRPAAAVIPEAAVPGGRRVRRRPAAAEGGGALDVPGEAVEPAEVVLEKFQRGEEVEGVIWKILLTVCDDCGACAPWLGT